MIAGGRWNPIGTPILYTAEHLSLACLEVLVHLDKRQLPRDYVWSRTDLNATPAKLCEVMPTSIVACQTLGAAWAGGNTALAVQVPSAVIPEGESNILLNAAHPAYQNLVSSTPRRFQFDQRLFITAPEPL